MYEPSSSVIVSVSNQSAYSLATYYIGTFANREDPDEMLLLRNAAFHQGVHCLIRE